MEIEDLGLVYQIKKDKVIAHMEKLGHIAVSKRDWDNCSYCGNTFYFGSPNENDDTVIMYLKFSDEDWKLFWRMDDADKINMSWQNLPCSKLKEEKEKHLVRLNRLISFK